MATLDRRGASVSAADPPVATTPNPDLAIKTPVRVATMAAIALAGLQTIDGVALAADDRVLVKDQADQTTNGIWAASSGNWTRTVDAANNSQWTDGAAVAVTDGTVNARAVFTVTATNPVVLGTSTLVFSQTNATAGTPLPIALGGTGASTAAAAQIALGLRERLTAGRTYYIRTAPVTVTISIGAGATVTWANHGLSTNDPVVLNTTGSLPSGLAVGVIYYAIVTALSTSVIQLATTPGGLPLATSGSQSGTHSAQTGNDANNGLTQTRAGAFLTIQGYVNTVAQKIDLGGNAVTGRAAKGWYIENVELQTYVGRGTQGHLTPLITSDTGLAADVIIKGASSAIAAIGATECAGLEWVVQNVNITNPGGAGIDADVGGWIALSGVIFSACANQVSGTGGVVEFSGPCTWAASPTSCGIQASDHSLILDSGNAHVISGTPTWAFAFAFFKNAAFGFFPGTTFAGASHGTRWVIDQTSFVDSEGADFDTMFPGDVAGGYSPSIEVRRGGTGQNALTAHAVVIGAGTSGVNVASTGTAGRVLIDQGGGADPAFEAVGGYAAMASNGTLTVNKVKGTSTNDSASAGDVGEFVISSGTKGTATVTISNASPGVVSWTAHGLNVGSPVNFTTTGALPTGLSVGTNYYVSSQGFTANSFSVSTSVANALAGTSVNTSSAGSGTHTAISTVILASTTACDVTGISLTAGDWDVWLNAAFTGGSTTTVNFLIASISTSSGVLGLPVGPQLNSQICYGLTPFNFANNFVVNVGPARLSLSGTTTIFLVSDASFGTSTCSGYGSISARRVR